MNNTMIKWVWATVSFFWIYWSLTLFTEATSAVPKGLQTAIVTLYKEYYIFVNGFIAFGMLTGVLAFIVLFIQLAQVGSNPYARIFILREMLVVGVATALLGGFPLLLVIYMEMFAT